MRSGAGDIVVFDIPVDQFAMQVFVYFIKKVFFSAVNYQCKIGFYKMYLVDYGVVVPAFGVFRIISKSLFHVPVIGEWSYIYSSAC